MKPVKPDVVFSVGFCLLVALLLVVAMLVQFGWPK